MARKILFVLVLILALAISFEARSLLQSYNATNSICPSAHGRRQHVEVWDLAFRGHGIEFRTNQTVLATHPVSW